MFAVNREHKTVKLDAYEEGAIIKGLNKIRTDQLERGESADFVSDVMLKIIQAPTKKPRLLGPPREPSEAGRVGRGGATEQASFCRDSGETSKRSPRRRNEAR